MAANLKLAASRDGNRAELAAAIEGVARAEAAVAAASAAEARAEERIDQAYEKLHAARADAASAEERQVAALVEEFGGAKPRAVISLAQAQAAVAEAEHVLATAKKALGHIKLAAEEPQRGLAKARGRGCGSGCNPGAARRSPQGRGSHNRFAPKDQVSHAWCGSRTAGTVSEASLVAPRTRRPMGKA